MQSIVLTTNDIGDYGLESSNASNKQFNIILHAICMAFVCHSYVLVYHPYVTRMYSCVIHMSLVTGFTMNQRSPVTDCLRM